MPEEPTREPGKPGRPRRTRPKAPPNPMGRPPKITEDRVDKICTSLMGHMSIEGAADIVGIDESTIRDWLRKGEASRTGKYADFARRVKEARGYSKLSLVTKIAADPAWQSAAWLLERRYPKEYGKHIATTHANPDGSPIATGGGGVTIVLNGVDGDDDNPFEPDLPDLPTPTVKAPPAPPSDVAIGDVP